MSSLINVTIAADGSDHILPLQVASSMTVADVHGLLEVELQWPAAQQEMLYKGRVLQPHETFATVGVQNDDMLLVRRRDATAATPAARNTLQQGSTGTVGGASGGTAGGSLEEVLARSLPQMLQAAQQQVQQQRANTDASAFRQQVLNDSATM